MKPVAAVVADGAVAEGATSPASLAGTVPSIALTSVGDFTFPGWDSIIPGTEKAVQTLYREYTGTLTQDVNDTIAALATADTVRGGGGPRG